MEDHRGLVSIDHKLQCQSHHAALAVSRTNDSLASRPHIWRYEPTPSQILMWAKPVSCYPSIKE